MQARIIIPITLLVLAISTAYAEEPALRIPFEVEKAALAGNWEQIVNQLKDVDPNSDSPVKRLIKGHACLALNRNNESLELFASALNEKDRKEWQAWADGLVGGNKKAAIAWYLQGDAFARRGKWNDAIKSFDRALEIDPNSYLALNARGVVSHAVGNTLQARMYFVKATKCRADFADAYASRGTLSVYLRSTKGMGSYVEARQFSKDKTPVLPLIGIGCMLYGEKDYPSARQYFVDISETSIVNELVQRNILTNELALLRDTLGKARDVGMSIESFQLSKGEDQSIYTVIVTEDGEIHIVLDDGEYIIYPDPDSQQQKSVQSNNAIDDEYINSPEGQAEIQKIKEWLEKNPDKWRTATGRRYIAILKRLGLWDDDLDEDVGEAENSEQAIPVELLPPIKLGVVALTTGPAKLGGRGDGIARPPSWGPSTPPGQDESSPGQKPKLGRKNNLAAIAGLVAAGINKQLTNFTPSTISVGGVDSDPTKARINKGSWGVCNVYGLLYGIDGTR